MDMGIEQKLGIRTFYFYLSKRVFIGLVLLIVAIIFSFMQSFTVSKVLSFLPKITAVSIDNYLIGGLFIFSILLIAGAFFISWLDYISCTFTLDENSFNIRRGIFNKKEVFIPFRQVQDINIEQTIYNKMMGVCKLIILTAGNDDLDKEGESQGIFEVIDASIAEKIRTDILKRTHVQATKEMV